MQWIGIFLLIALAASFFNYKSTLVNFSFARMRKKYIEDNDEQDPALIEKVAPYYQHTSQVLGGTQLSFVVCGAVFGVSIFGIDTAIYEEFIAVLGEDMAWAGVLTAIIFSALALAAYWIGTILIPGSHALVEPLPILAGQTWVISMNRHLFRPIVMPGLYLIKKFFKWRNIPLRNEVNFTYTEDEIRCIVEESHRSGRLNALENTLIKNSFDFFNLMVRDVMVPRSDMVVLNYEDEIDEMRRTISKAHHTCYPVCMDDKDHILGFIHVKNFLESLLHGEFNVKRIMRDILMVPETMPAPTLLQLMKNTRTYLAVVADEYGSTSGLATLEDLIEELVGEIPQGADQAPYEIIRKGEGVYEFDGTVILEDVSDRLEIDLAEEDKNATIGGFVFSRLERIPKVGDSIEFGGWRFTVLRVAGFRIVRLKAEKIAPPEGEAEEAPEEKHEA